MLYHGEKNSQVKLTLETELTVITNMKFRVQVSADFERYETTLDHQLEIYSFDFHGIDSGESGAGFGDRDTEYWFPTEVDAQGFSDYINETYEGKGVQAFGVATINRDDEDDVDVSL